MQRTVPQNRIVSGVIALCALPLGACSGDTDASLPTVRSTPVRAPLLDDYAATECNFTEPTVVVAKAGQSIIDVHRLVDGCITSTPEAVGADKVEARLNNLASDKTVIVASQRVATRPLSANEPSQDPAAPQPSWRALLAKIGGPTSGWNTGAGVTVAIIDAPIDPNHPSLALDLRGASADAAAFDGHGTAVAGLIVGQPHDESGFAGVAPDATLVSVSMFGGDGAQTMSQFEALQRAAASGARVINMSVGSSVEEPGLAELVSSLRTQGINIVAAVGNCGRMSDTTSECPDGDETLAYPAATDGVIGVGATTTTGAHLATSTINSSVDIVAPGSEVLTTCLRAKLCADAIAGTSPAAAIVSGVIAQLLTAKPSATPDEIDRALLATAADIDPDGPDTATGHGFVAVTNAVEAMTPVPVGGGTTNTLAATPPAAGASSTTNAPAATQPPTPTVPTRDVHTFDFENMSYETRDARGGAIELIELVGGSMPGPFDEDPVGGAEFGRVEFGDIDGDGVDEAVVQLFRIGNSAQPVYFFLVGQDTPLDPVPLRTSVQVRGFPSDFVPTARIEGEQLVVNHEALSDRFEEGESMASPGLELTTTYRYDGDRLIEVNEDKIVRELSG